MQQKKWYLILGLSVALTASVCSYLMQGEQTGIIATDAQGAAAEKGNRPPEQDGEGKRIAITFDDGPHPSYTKQLLDGLAKRQVHATFFVIGRNIPGNEALIARMEQEGHLIGNHTYDHVKISNLSAEDACEQVEKTSALVRGITGHDTEFIRPPCGVLIRWTGRQKIRS